MVLDALTAKPVDDVTVPLAPFGSAKVVSTTTDRNGAFSFPGVTAGRYSLRTDKEHWQPGDYGKDAPEGRGQALTVVAGRSVNGLRIKMWAWASFVGHVHSADGKAVEGAWVEVLGRNWRAGRPYYDAVDTVRTDADGSFTLRNCLPGEYIVVATSTFLSGDPDERARWAHDALPQTFFPSATSLAEATRLSVDWGDVRFGVEIVAKPSRGATIRGRVLGMPKPMPGLHVELFADDRVNLEGLEPVTSLLADGTFEFTLVPPGRYNLRIDTTGLTTFPMTATESVSLAAGETRDLQVQLHAPFHVSGHAIFSGTGAPPNPQDVDIELFRANGLTDFRIQASVLRSGLVSFSAVPPGEYVVVARPTAGWQMADATFQGRSIADGPLRVAGGDVEGIEVVFSKESSRVEGRVTSRSGLRDVMVAIFPVNTNLWQDYGPSPRRLKATHPAGSGMFTFTDLPPDDYYVVAFVDPGGDWSARPHLDRLALAADRVQVGHDGAVSKTLTVTEVKWN